MMKVINTYPISAVHEYINCPEDWKVFTWISVHGLSVQCVFLIMADHPFKEPIKQSVFFSQVRYWGLPMVLFRWNSLFSNGAQLQFLLSVSLSLHVPLLLELLLLELLNGIHLSSGTHLAHRCRVLSLHHQLTGHLIVFLFSIDIAGRNGHHGRLPYETSQQRPNPQCGPVDTHIRQHDQACDEDDDAEHRAGGQHKGLLQGHEPASQVGPDCHWQREEGENP